jgi:hypothetical protein
MRMDGGKVRPRALAFFRMKTKSERIGWEPDPMIAFDTLGLMGYPD